VMVFTAPAVTEARSPGGHAQILTASGLIGRRHLIFGEDGFIWAFRDACATINAGVRVNVIPGPFILRQPRDNTFNRADLNTAAIPQAQAGDNVGHLCSSVESM